MGNKPSFMLQDEEIKLIAEETGFSPSQIERLYSRFTALDKSGNGSLSRQDCLAIPELAINPLCDRIVQMFFVDCDDDHDRINFRQFMKVLATFKSTNKSTPLTRSRAVSRQESLNRQQRQSLYGQASLLFDSLDSPFTSVLSRHSRHSRHSSFHGFNHINIYNQQPQHHHTTNQHSVHYAASLTHLPVQSSSYFMNNNFQLNNNNNNNELNHINGFPFSAKNKQPPLVDPDEPLNSKKHKLLFMFKVYDVNNDNLIDINDLISIIKMMVGTYVDEQRVRRIAETTLKEADVNCDGYIDFEEFCKSFTTRKDIEESLKVKFPQSYAAYSVQPTHFFTRLFSN